jgi:DhnA family fructose-bisphosphate aldolase class Ia
MNNKQVRLKEIFNSSDGRSLVLDASQGLMFGALPGMERFREAVSPLLPLLDGIVTSPGQSRYLDTRTCQDITLLVRADWTNALRGSNFVLPPENIQYCQMLDPSDALDLGANALVMHFILGYEEAIEAQCMKVMVNLALDGANQGMPLIVDIQPIGPRIVLQNKAIELGASFALEGGTNGIAIPWPGAQSFKTIQAMCIGIPVWIKSGEMAPDAAELAEAFALGAKGIWLDEHIFASKDSVTSLTTFRALVHSPVGI